MFLALDVGNTNVVVGVFGESTNDSIAHSGFSADFSLAKTWRLSTHPVSTSDEFVGKLLWLLERDGFSLLKFEAIVVSSVVPQFTDMLHKAFARQKLCIIDSDTPFSFRILANPPTQVGADRLVNAEAAVREYGAPCIIVDSGTATTLCAVDQNKNYLGGAILPGLELAVASLASRAAKLFTVELVAPPQVIGSNTIHAIQSGLMEGYASMIDGMIEKFKKELIAAHGVTAKIKVIGTGGITERLRPLTHNIEIFDADLTLKGMAALYATLRAR